MFKTNSVSSSGKSNLLTVVFKAGLLSFVFSLAMVLIFALVVKLANVNNTIIEIVNQIIKSLSAFLGVLFAVKERNAWFLKGFLGGALFALISFVVFSVFGGQFKFFGLFIDILVCSFAGIVGALVSVGKK